MPIIQPGAGPYLNNAIEDQRTTPEIQRQTALQAFFAEQQRRAEAEAAAIQAQIDAEQRAAEAAEQAAQAAVMGAVDPAARVGTERGRATNTGTAEPAPASMDNRPFVLWLAQQQYEPAVRTLTDLQQAPLSVQRAIVDAGASSLAEVNPSLLPSIALVKAQMYADYVTAEKPTALGRAKDIGLSAVEGLGASIKSISDLISPTSGMSEWMRGQLKEIEDAKTPDTQRAKAFLEKKIATLGDQGTTMDQFKIWLEHGVAESPAQTAANLAGSMATAFVGKLAGAAHALKAAGAIGAAQGGGAVRGAAYDTARADAKARGLTDAEADAAASDASTMSNVGGKVAAGAALGAVAGSTGAERLLNPGNVMTRVGDQLAARLATSRGARVALRATGGATTEAIPEAAQGALERYSGNRASADAGLRPESTVMDGVGLAAMQSATLGAVAGGAVQGVMPALPGGDHTDPAAPQPTAPVAPAVAPPEAAAPAPPTAPPPAPAAVVPPDDVFPGPDQTGIHTRSTPPVPAAPVQAPVVSAPAIPSIFNSAAEITENVKVPLTPDQAAWVDDRIRNSDSGQIGIEEAKAQGIQFRDAPAGSTAERDAAAQAYRADAAKRGKVDAAKTINSARARESHNLPAEVHDALLGTMTSQDTTGSMQFRSAKTVYEKIANSTDSKNPSNQPASATDRAVARWLADNIDPAVSIEAGVSVAHLGLSAKNEAATKRARGFYVYQSDSPAQGSIFLNAVRGMNRHSVLHEGVHAVTNQYLDTDPATLSATQAAARAEIERMHNALASNPHPDMGHVYAYDNVKEFTAEGLSNPAFQDYLRATPWEVDQSMWEKFKGTLRSMIGLGENVIPKSAFDALLDASDTMVAGRGQPLSGTPGEQVADAVSGQRPVVDTAFARLPGEGATSARGSAIWNPDTQAFDVVWHRPAGGTQRASLPSMYRAKTWLRGRAPDVTVDVVQSRSRAEDQASAVLLKAMIDLEGLNPGAMQAYEKINAFISAIPGMSKVVPPHAVHSALRAVSVANQAAGARYNATDKVLELVRQYRAAMVPGSDEHYAASDLMLRVGEDAVLRQQAKGMAERTVAGFGKKNWADHREAVIKARKGMVKAGVPDSVVSDLAYAYAAAQRNAVAAHQYPTDVDGRGKQDDYAKFSWVADRNGNILDISDTAALPPGAKVMSGKAAAMEYKRQFARQFPQHVPAATAMLNGIRAGNQHVLDYQLANGAITTSEHHQLSQIDYYLPMQQTDSARSARIRQATGRTTKATDPMAQWMAIHDARIESAARAGSIQALGMAFQQMPMPHLATINSSSAKLAPSTDGGIESVVAFAKRDWRGTDSVVFRVGDEMFQLTIHDKDLLRALKPEGLDRSAGTEKALHVARAVTGFLSFVRVSANPAFILKQLAWDPIVAVANMQGAFSPAGAGGSMVTNAQAAKLSATMLSRILPSMADALRNQSRAQFGQRADPVRQLYDSQGGGIRIESKYSFGDNQRNPLDIIRGETRRDSTSRTLLAKVVNGGSNVAHTVSAIGHVASDAIRFAAFKSYLEMQHGGAFPSEAALARYVQDNPSIVATAITGSKNLIGNFERMGSNTLARINFPFFNAGMVGTTQMLPQILGSSWGRQSLALIAGLATLAAMAAFDDPEDVDEDGDSRFAASPRSDDSIVFGRTAIPIPPELQFAVTGGKLMAAMLSDRSISAENLWDSVKRTLVNMSPIRSPDFENAGPLQALGLVGIPLMMMAGQDGFGNSVLPSRTDPGKPERIQDRPVDSASAIAVADGLHAMTSWLPGGSADVAPGTITSVAQQFGGALYGMASAWDKAGLEKADGATAAFAYVTKSYRYDPADSKFDLMERRDENQRKLYEEATALDKAGVAAIDQRVAPAASRLAAVRSSSGKTLTQLTAALADARRAGRSDEYQQLLAEREDLGRRRSVVIGQTVNMLRQ